MWLFFFVLFCSDGNGSGGEGNKGYDLYVGKGVWRALSLSLSCRGLVQAAFMRTICAEGIGPTLNFSPVSFHMFFYLPTLCRTHSILAILSC